MGKGRHFVIWGLLFVCCISLWGGVYRGYIGQRESVPVSSTVSWGTSGEQVRKVQQKLQELGFYKGKVDGIYGTNTYNAIVAFQKSKGLKADGIAGPQTLSALGITKPAPTEQQVQDELYLLASAIHGEGRGEPYEGQVAIGAVILNRVEDPRFPNTITEVIMQNGAFDAVADGQISLTPNEAAFKAAEDALNGWDPTEGAVYYWNPATATSKWIWTVPISKTIGRHVFGSK